MEFAQDNLRRTHLFNVKISNIIDMYCHHLTFHWVRTCYLGCLKEVLREGKKIDNSNKR